jgi:hypothetical protein
MKQSVLKHKQLRICAALLVADGLVFMTVDPQSAPAIWLIVGYILLGVSLFATAALFATAFRSYGQRIYKTAWRLLAYAATALIIMIGLQSIGQLTIRDVLTLLPFTLIAYWYFGYSKRQTAMARANN